MYTEKEKKKLKSPYKL